MKNLITTSSSSMETAFADFLRIDVGNGDARPDTVRAYLMHVKKWIERCQGAGVDPRQATPDTVKEYRRELIERGAKHSTIALKLTIIRRFYAAALGRGLVATNPVDGIRPPKDRQAEGASIKFLTAGELELLFRAVPRTDKTKDLRDRAMLALMSYEGLRDVEIHRACVGDLLADGRMLVRGKGKDAYITPRKDTMEAIQAYLLQRPTVAADGDGVPLFTAEGNRAGGARIGREGIRNIVNQYLIQQGLKKEGLSCHALRHTCASLLYQATKDAVIVQKQLRHNSLDVTTRYIHSLAPSEMAWTELIPVTM